VGFFDMDARFFVEEEMDATVAAHGAAPIHKASVERRRANIASTSGTSQFEMHRSKAAEERGGNSARSVEDVHP